MNVFVPCELEGIDYIKVTIQRVDEQLVSATPGLLSNPAAKSVELHWQQQQLEAGSSELFVL